MLPLMPHTPHIRRRLDRPSRRQASDDWPAGRTVDPSTPSARSSAMRRIRTTAGPLLVVLAIAVMVAPSGSARGGPFTYPPGSGATADHTGIPGSVVLAIACLLLAAVTVLPRRNRKAP
jgi:hypothetical protein